MTRILLDSLLVHAEETRQVGTQSGEILTRGTKSKRVCRVLKRRQ
jgi:hypothetical protein